jgi:hypothetical protein
MNNISISPRFFKTELRNYSNHLQALVRELIQNAVDSPGCRNIQITHSLNFISIKDDGRGMNRDVLLNKYLSMGETTKEGDGNIGGFGKARTLTNWAQRSYEIISHDYRLLGEGSGYEIHDNSFTNGCEFKINTDQEEWGYIITNYLNKCSFRQNITVNGEVFKSEISRGRFARDLKFGSVWVNKSATSQLLVRVNGILMFRRAISASAQVIIEITPEISRDVLLSNRDSLQYEFQQEIEEFCNEIATESESALKTKTKKFTQFRNRGVAVISKKKQNKKKIDFAEIDDAALVSLISSPTYQETIEISSNFEPSTESKWYDPAILSLESDEPILVKAAKFYDLSEIDESTTRIKLLKVWKTILDFVTEKYTERYNHEFSWGFGWVLSSDCAAQCKTVDNIHYLLLNPICEKGKMKFSINKKDSLSDLIVFAAHEVAHVASNRHDESFAACLTFLLADCLKDIGTIFRTIKGLE